MFAVVDVGGTKTRVAASHDLSALGTVLIIDTPRNYQEGIDALSASIQKVCAGESPEHVAIGIRGVIAPDGRVMHGDHVLADWVDKPIATELEQKVGAKSVTLMNDTAIVGLGEAVFGPGANVPLCVYITVSTGANGVRIVDGAIDVSRQGFEIGGQYLSMNPMQTFEELVSGAAIERRFGMHPRDLGKGHEIWEELARVTAFAVHNTILHWSPDMVIFGGSMFNEIGISVERIHAHLADIMTKFPALPELKHSTLGDIGGLWGGVALLKSKE